MKGKMTINETWSAVTERLARLLQAHHRYVTLVANPRDGQTVAPFTQVAWRDDCSMQLEAVSDQFLDYVLDDEQCKLQHIFDRRLRFFVIRVISRTQKTRYRNTGNNTQHHHRNNQLSQRKPVVATTKAMRTTRAM